MGEQSEWPVGTRVVVRNPDSWADGREGTVLVSRWDQWPDRCTVELDGGDRYLAFDSDLRTAPFKRRTHVAGC